MSAKVFFSIFSIMLHIVSDKCTVPSSIHGLIKHCIREFSSKREDQLSYYAGWQRDSTDPATDADEAFQYRTEDDLKTLPYFGKHHLYSDGGYVLNLGNTLAGITSIPAVATF